MIQSEHTGTIRDSVTEVATKKGNEDRGSAVYVQPKLKTHTSACMRRSAANPGCLAPTPTPATTLLIIGRPCIAHPIHQHDTNQIAREPRSGGSSAGVRRRDDVPKKLARGSYRAWSGWKKAELATAKRTEMTMSAKVVTQHTHASATSAVSMRHCQ